HHRTLTKVNSATEAAKETADKAREKFVKEFDKARAAAQKDFQKLIDDVQKNKELNPQQAAIELLTAQQSGQRRLDARLEQIKRVRDRETKASEQQMAQEVRHVQDRYKLWAVLLPPIPPLIVAFIVFFNRRANEREGVSKSRLR